MYFENYIKLPPKNLYFCTKEMGYHRVRFSTDLVKK